jgi:hypothetical protein
MRTLVAGAVRLARKGPPLSEVAGLAFFFLMLATLPAWLIYEVWSTQEGSERPGT